MTASLLHIDAIRALEERSLNAWPAHQTVLHGGWALRLSGGFTKRANSANAVEPGAPFAGVREAAAALYARQGLAAVFRLSPLAPPEADRELAAAGYEHFEPSLVLHRPLVAAPSPADPAVRLAPTPSSDWMEGFAAANGVAPHHRGLHRLTLQAIAQPAAFATLTTPQGHAAGFGLAVLERGAVGLYDIAVAPAQRGCGRGRALVQALLHWGAAAGATSAYLQVRAHNAVALRLYESLGFGVAYRYHYRAPPAR